MEFGGEGGIFTNRPIGSGIQHGIARTYKHGRALLDIRMRKWVAKIATAAEEMVISIYPDHVIHRLMYLNSSIYKAYYDLSSSYKCAPNAYS